MADSNNHKYTSRRAVNACKAVRAHRTVRIAAYLLTCIITAVFIFSASAPADAYGAAASGSSVTGMPSGAAENSDAASVTSGDNDDEYVYYTFPQINTRIAIPKSMITFTNSVTSADPNLSKIGASADQVRIMFDKNNLYLEAMPENLSYEVILGGVKRNDLQNFNDMSDEELKKAYDEYEAKCRAASMDTVYSMSTYNNGNYTYFVEDFSTISNDVTVYSRKYYTVAEGCEIYISLQTKMVSAGDPNDSTTYVFDEAAAMVARDIVDRASYSPMKEHFTDTSMFSELFGYILGIAVTIGVLALILLLLIKTTSKPKKRR